MRTHNHALQKRMIRWVSPIACENNIGNSMKIQIIIHLNRHVSLHEDKSFRAMRYKWRRFWCPFDGALVHYLHFISVRFLRNGRRKKTKLRPVASCVRWRHVFCMCTMYIVSHCVTLLEKCFSFSFTLNGHFIEHALDSTALKLLQVFSLYLIGNLFAYFGSCSSPSQYHKNHSHTRLFYQLVEAQRYVANIM